MKFYFVDTDGWWGWEGSIKNAEDYLELFDLANEEYLVIDSNGNIYNYVESNEKYPFYKLVKSGNKDESLPRIFDRQLSSRKKMYYEDLDNIRRYSTKKHSD